MKFKETIQKKNINYLNQYKLYYEKLNLNFKLH